MSRYRPFLVLARRLAFATSVFVAAYLDSALYWGMSAYLLHSEIHDAQKGPTL